MDDIYVIKSNGEKELFSEDKLRRSISRAGIPEDKSAQVLSRIKESAYPDIPTSIIYKNILNCLGEVSDLSGKYSLKQSIMELGPTGYPFEKFVAKVYSYQGYFAETDKIMKGRCVSHEVDVVAVKNSENYLMECKYHNMPGRRTDIKTALYVWARYEDIMAGDGYINLPHRNIKIFLVTNTKCTTDAIAYANCKGMNILSWGYPPKGNLEDMIEQYRLHPITCLKSLTKEDIRKLLLKDLVLCKDILSHHEDMERIHLSRPAEFVRKEAEGIVTV